MPPDDEQDRPATLAESLDQLAARIADAASNLRDLLAREELFGEEFGYARWQLLSVLNSLGLHEGTVRELRRLVERRRGSADQPDARHDET